MPLETGRQRIGSTATTEEEMTMTTKKDANGGGAGDTAGAEQEGDDTDIEMYEDA